MTTRIGALGRLFDIGAGITPVNLNTGANTGKRISMEDCEGITFVIFAGVGTAASDIPCDLQEYTAYTGGTTADLDIITNYYHKSELALDNDETWTLVTQTAASEISDIGGAGTSGEFEQIGVIEVTADQLSDGYTHVGLNIAQPGATKLGCVLYIKWGLKVQRIPSNLPNLLNPGAANA
ncbi:MAG TPA: hypothetical protein DCP69_00780 [Candidatus Omnitrophica bacterium]|nr:hypothetical protein [Candidatus Omnitrophota bacterium]